MFDKIYKNVKPAEVFTFMQGLVVNLERLETQINHGRNKFISGETSEKEIWQAIIEIIQNKKL